MRFLQVKSSLVGIVAWALASALSWSPCRAQTTQADAPTSCDQCHKVSKGQAQETPLAEVLSHSAHAGLDCTACHESISLDEVKPQDAKPHGASVPKVDCSSCHEDEAASYVKHGQYDAGAKGDIPTCASCHGTHNILPSSDPKSTVHRLNIAATCEACHTNTDLIKNHEILKEEPIKLYEASVHGKATEGGLYLAATCSDCHGAADEEGHASAHRILSPADPNSPINYFNIPKTCGKCHRGTEVDYWEGIHGQLVQRGEVAAPVCTRCHGEHGILPTSDLRSPVSAARLAVSTCSPCHESVALNERFGISGGRLQSYVDSYHGLKSKAGSVHVANCASCHGTHRILAHTDPRSTINLINLQTTCGQCHPNISTTLAQTPIHSTATGTKTGWPRFFTILYLWVIGLTVAVMLVHNFAHWFRHVRLAGRAKYVIRLTAAETAQHWVLMLSFIVLVISGFSLRFSESWWVNLMFGWGSGEGFVVRGTIHRVAGVIFIMSAVWHMLYLCTSRGRHWLRDIFPTKKDALDIRDNALYFLGRRPEEPKFGRFSYVEKVEYWALMWGTVIMVITGIFLWFDNYFADNWNMKGALDVFLVIHYYEAWLATLSILIWHIYSTVFSPSVYPMNPAWWSGKMPHPLYEHEHPQGPKLRAFSGTPTPELENHSGNEKPNDRKDA